MTKQHKNIFGLFGLLMVAFTTTFAASLPPVAAANEAVTSITDTISVRVIGDTPEIVITNPKSVDGEPIEFVDPNQTVDFEFVNIDTRDLYLTYVDADGTPTEEHTVLEPVDYYPGEESFLYDLSEYGYGEFTVKMTGDGIAGPTEKAINFSYLPLIATIEREEDDAGNPSVHLEYNPDDVKSAVIEVLDKDGNPIFAPITVDPMTNDVILPFFENKIKSGDYTIKVTAFDADGEMIYGPYSRLLSGWSSLHIPDTGALFQNLNISRTDYLLTGLIIFSITAVFSLIFTIKNKKNRAKSKRRR